MTSTVSDMVAATLAERGRSLTEYGQIVHRGGALSGIFIDARNRRLRFMTRDLPGRDSVLFTGPIDADTVRSFGRQFWYDAPKA